MGNSSARFLVQPSHICGKLRYMRVLTTSATTKLQAISCALHELRQFNIFQDRAGNSRMAADSVVDIAPDEQILTVRCRCWRVAGR